MCKLSPSAPRIGARRLAVILLVAIVGATNRVKAADAYVAEYDLKATHLFHFAQFVKWPPRAFSSPGSPFTIGILGVNPFGSSVESVINGENIEGHKMTTKRSRRVDDLLDCQIVFICRSEESHIASILSTLSARSILTVSDLPGFCRQGGMIGFMIEGELVRFEIRSSATKTAGLKVSSQLLKLSR